MRKIVYSILIVSFVFLLNIGLYFYSDSYSFFLKKIKYWEETSLLDKNKITDEYLLSSLTSLEKDCNCEPLVCDNNQNLENNFEKVDDLIDVKPVQSQENIQNEIINQNNQKINEYIKKFSNYKLLEKSYDEYYKIFDITDEYPNKYTTYQAWDLEIYFFPLSNFDEIYNIFNFLINDDLITNKFDLNKTNNFWKKSFFINLKTQDEFVRLVIDDWNILFWLKIKKGYYWDIKKILQNF